MIKKECVDRINKSLASALSQQGIKAAGVKFESWIDNIGQVAFAKDIGNKYAGEIGAIADFLAGLPDVDRVEDESRGLHLRGTETRILDVWVKDGRWESTPEDDAKAEQEIAAATEGTPEYAARVAKEESDRRAHYKDYILPIPPPKKNSGSEIYLVLRYEAYDAIKSGAKRTEFRDYTENYVAKLLSHPIKTVRFQRGYGNRGKQPEQMVWLVKDVSLYDIGTRTECKPGEEPKGFLASHIAIDLDRRLTREYEKKKED